LCDVLNFRTIKFHLIFADPPYGIDQKELKISSLVFEKELLDDQGMMIRNILNTQN
jgi:16S rRNA G966 N2-methylase RsmD